MGYRNMNLAKQAFKRDDYTCCNCGGEAEAAHHIVPLAVGGKDIVSNLASLCNACHGLVHGRDFTNHRALTIAGIERAKKRGVKFGGLRPNTIKENKAAKEAAMRRSEQLRPMLTVCVSRGMSLREMSAALYTEGIATKRGLPYSPSAVKSHLTRLGLCADRAGLSAVGA